jgi:hypothetical protein
MGGSRDSGLLSGQLFCFDRSVLAKDNGASLSTVDPEAAQQNDAVGFMTNHWSVALEAQGQSPAAHIHPNEER